VGNTRSQLHSPVAFLPQEHLTPVEVGGTDEPCVVKSMGMEDILPRFKLCLEDKRFVLA
jgi:hypothetical protein